MSAMGSQITDVSIVYSTVYSGADQRKHQSPASLAFMRGIHRGPLNSPHKWLVKRRRFSFDDVTMVNSMVADNLVTQRARVSVGMALTPHPPSVASVNRVSIGSDNDLSPIQYQAII